MYRIGGLRREGNPLKVRRIGGAWHFRCDHFGTENVHLTNPPKVQRSAPTAAAESWPEGVPIVDAPQVSSADLGLDTDKPMILEGMPAAQAAEMPNAPPPPPTAVVAGATDDPVATAPDAADLAEPWVESAQRMLDQLNSIAPEEPAEVAVVLSEETLPAVEQRLSVAGSVLDSFPKGTAEGRELREVLLDAYFRVDRMLQDFRDASAASDADPLPAAPAPRPASRKSKADTKSQVAVAPRAPSRPGRGRAITLVVFILLAVGGRIGLWLYSESQKVEKPILSHQAATDGARVELKGGHKPAKQLSAGIPIVTSLRVQRTKQGLRAVAVAIDTDNAAPTLEYRWFRGDTVLKVETKGFLPASEIAVGGAFRVEATASDGTFVSEPVSTEAMQIAPAPLGGAEEES